MITTLLVLLLSFGLGDVYETVQLRNPPPLLLGLDISQMPFEYFEVSLNPAYDIGAFEYWPPFTPVIRGDISFDNEVGVDDLRWFDFCLTGPGSPYRIHLRKITTQELVSVACWLCDYDGDGDVDMMDFGVQQTLLILGE